MYSIICPLDVVINVITEMREWLSWWSATLPRSRPRVRVPSRALVKSAETLINTAFPFFFVSANLKTVYKAFVMRLYVSDSVSGLYIYPSVVERLLCPSISLIQSSGTPFAFRLLA